MLENNKYDQQLAQEKEKSLFLQAPISNITILVMTTMVFLVLYGRVMTSMLILWLSVIFFMVAVRLVLWSIHRKTPDRFTSGKWITIYTAATGLFGLVWSSLYLFGYGISDPVVSFVLYMVFLGVLGAAAFALSCHMPIFIVYTYPQGIIFSSILILNRSPSNLLIGSSVFLYLIMMTLFARNTNRQFVNTVYLQNENASLIDDLNCEVEQRETLIEKRTHELLTTNKALGKEVNERKNAQAEVGFQVSILNSVLNSTPDLIYYKDYVNLDGCYIGCNEAYAKLVGLDKKDIIGKNDIEVFGEEEGHYLRVKDQVALHADHTFMYEEQATYPDGTSILLSALKSPFYDHNNKLLGILCVGRDITDMKSVEQQLKKNELTLHHLAHHDPLTGLPNRLLLVDRLKQSIKKAERASAGLALMFIDLDHFKEINDSLGHSVGDQLLQAVATRLKQSIRKEDTAARLGGDEFTVILEELDNHKYASALAEKLITAFKEPLKLEGREITITLSIGISLFPEHGQNTETLLRNADSAMYRAKSEGRNGYSLYTKDLTQRAVERLELEAALRKSIVNKELQLYFQPQIDLHSGKIIGSEALLRWILPKQGLLSPDFFIPLAEETGLINEIGMWVFKTSCEKVIEWEKAGLTNLKMAVNLSGRQLLDDNFVNEVRMVLEQTGCKAELIELEITEGYLIEHPEKTVIQFNELREIGIQIAIDDFGTGYSSLTYLKQFPISKLKIDYSFIRDILIDTNDQAITRAIIALAKSLDLKVIAEGVENEKQKDFLLTEGCDEAQGYYFARPMPEVEFLKYIKKYTLQ